MKIAAFDIIEFHEYYDPALGITPSGPFNENFNTLGFESLYFVNNLGSMALAYVVYCISLTFMMLLSLCAWQSRRIKDLV